MLLTALLGWAASNCYVYPQVSATTLHPFTHNGRVGYVNDDLKVVIAPQFLRADHFSNDGYATVEIDEITWGVIDTRGRLLFSKRMVVLSLVSEGFCFGFEYPRGDRHGMIISVTGEVLVDRLGSALSFSEGLCPVRFYDRPGWTYIDKEGNIALNDTYYRTNEFHNGIAMVERRTDAKAGFIDRQGQYIIPPRFYELGSAFSEGLCYARIGKKTGYIDHSGEFVFTVPISFNTPFEDGVAMIKTNEDPNIWKIINKKGEWVIGDLPIISSMGFREGLAKITVNKKGKYKHGFVDKSGNFVINPVYDEAESFTNGYSRVVLDGRDGLLGTKGNVYWSDELYSSD